MVSRPNSLIGCFAVSMRKIEPGQMAKTIRKKDQMIGLRSELVNVAVELTVTAVLLVC